MQRPLQSSCAMASRMSRSPPPRLASFFPDSAADHPPRRHASRRSPPRARAFFPALRRVLERCPPAAEQRFCNSGICGASGRGRATAAPACLEAIARPGSRGASRRRRAPRRRRAQPARAGRNPPTRRAASPRRGRNAALNSVAIPMPVTHAAPGTNVFEVAEGVYCIHAQARLRGRFPRQAGGARPRAGLRSPRRSPPPRPAAWPARCRSAPSIHA